MLLKIYRPQNKKELFNLRHASARNVIERIFGVLKRRFRILLIAPEYNLDIQARIPAALCAIHNFISAHDLHEDTLAETQDFFDDSRYGSYESYHMEGVEEEETGPSIKRDNIAQEMWDDYRNVLNARAAQELDLSDDEFGSDDEMFL